MVAYTKFVFLGVVLSGFSHFFANGAHSCNLPSRFWCDNEDVATKCGVLQQCKEFVWRSDAKKVDLVLFYESLCPDCQEFITRMLYPNYANLSSIMNLTLVPYGNAREKKVGDKWEFDCQHGEEECVGNIIETCTIALVKDISKYFPFINCMEKSRMNPKAAAKKCSAAYPVPLEDIFNCTKSDYGNQLQHQMALKTAALDPPHQYVPWVTVNGVHTEAIQKEAEKNLVKLICDTYKGEKPPVCK